MKGPLSASVLSALVLTASAKYNFDNDPRSTCSDSLAKGFDFLHLDPSQWVSGFGGLSWVNLDLQLFGAGGWDWDSAWKGLAGLGATIAADVEVGLPSFSYGGRAFYLDEIEIAAKVDVSLNINYLMPDKTTCVQTIKTGPKGSKAKNDKCGGAVGIEFGLLEGVKLDADLEIAIGSIKFDCNSSTATQTQIATSTWDQIAATTSQHPSSGVAAHSTTENAAKPSGSHGSQASGDDLGLGIDLDLGIDLPTGSAFDFGKDDPRSTCSDSLAHGFDFLHMDPLQWVSDFGGLLWANLDLQIFGAGGWDWDSAWKGLAGLGAKIAADVEVGLPGFSYGGRAFYLAEIEIAAKVDVSLNINYLMPDKTKCVQTIKTGPKGSKAKNDKCGGAVGIEFGLLEGVNLDVDLEIAIGSMKFDCNPGKQTQTSTRTWVSVATPTGQNYPSQTGSISLPQGGHIPGYTTSTIPATPTGVSPLSASSTSDISSTTPFPTTFEYRTSTYPSASSSRAPQGYCVAH